MKQLFKITSLAGMITGGILCLAGIIGIIFTYSSVTREKITTPPEASIKEASVRGPFTLKSQADIIRANTLTSTNGKTYSEMPGRIPRLDAEGKPVMTPEGTPVLIPNAARDIWITATTLTTALNLGIIAYALSALVIFLGLVLAWAGILCGVACRRMQ